MVEIVDGHESFIDGIDTYLTYGHTKGLMHPIISDGVQTLFYGADIFPLSAHIPVPWVMSYDVQPGVTMQEKEELLIKMREEGWFLFFEHDPNIQACTVDRLDKHYRMNETVIISE